MLSQWMWFVVISKRWRGKLQSPEKKTSSSWTCGECCEDIVELIKSSLECVFQVKFQENWQSPFTMSKTKAGEFYTSTCPPLHAVIVLMLILHNSMTTLEASNNACDVSRSTIQIVKNCPDSEEKWRKAAARKNCEAYANQCSDPKRLVYHCLLNEYINQTLEVCAYAQNIVLGYCTYYSGNRILPNFRTSCKNFVKNPCPEFYRSTEAFKYKGCYELTKKSGHFWGFEVIGRKKISSFAVPAASTDSTLIRNEKEDVTNTVHIPVGVAFLVILLVICLLCFCRRIIKNNRRDRYHDVFVVS